MSGNEDEIGFTIAARKSRRHSKECLADLDFAYDIPALANAIDQAQQLLHEVESKARKCVAVSVAPKPSLSPITSMKQRHLYQKSPGMESSKWND